MSYLMTITQNIMTTNDFGIQLKSCLNDWCQSNGGLNIHVLCKLVTM